MNQKQLKEGVDQFNGGYFFECHDTLEELWMETVGTDRLFLQGLIQVSVGFYHLFNHNFKGATSQFDKGVKKLEAYCPSHCGVELDRFVAEVAEWRGLAGEGLEGRAIDMDEARVPKLSFVA